MPRRVLPTLSLVALCVVVAACGGRPTSGGTTPVAPVCPAAPACTACPALDGSADAMNGVWIDQETNAAIVIGATGGKVYVVFAMDDDGELWPAALLGYDGRTLHFSYFVPSTGYRLENWVELVDPNTMTGRHTGSHVATDDKYLRWRPAPATPATDEG